MVKKSIQNNLATKKDLNKLASKVDFKNLRREVLKIEVRVENVEEKIEKIDIKLDRIENKIDRFVGGVETLKQENSVGADQYRKHDLKIEDHEARIAALEPAA